MVTTKRAVLIPIWFAFMAAALLLALLVLRASPVSAPTFSLQQLVTGPAASPAQTSHVINRSGPTSFSVPQDASQQTGDQAPASATCPTQPGIEMSCTQER